MSENEFIPMTRRTFLNMVQAIPELHERKTQDGERVLPEKGYRERLETWFGKRWNKMAPATVRAVTAKAPVRFPSVTEHPQFFDDLREFGAMEFTKTGTVKPKTRNIGPDIRAFLEEAKRIRGERRAA